MIKIHMVNIYEGTYHNSSAGLR